ncbi:MAG: hypothetical protein H6611_00905 [Ignavibacteriales bacterium]|nr:hypothetical protein [Ignavibacteriales bacterium]
MPLTWNWTWMYGSDKKVNQTGLINALVDSYPQLLVIAFLQLKTDQFNYWLFSAETVWT